MPQFDPSTFASQIFWLVVTFVALYLLMARLVLPRITDILGQREDRIDGNLRRAEGLKEEADQVLAAYQKAISDARHQAQAAMAQAAAEITASATRRESEFGRKMAAETAAAETRIRAAKTQALADVRGIAAEVAAMMAVKLTGNAVDPNQAVQTVDGVMKERAR